MIGVAMAQTFASQPMTIGRTRKKLSACLGNYVMMICRKQPQRLPETV